MWYLIVSIPDLCTLTYFVNRSLMKIEMKINEMSSKFLLKVKSQLSNLPLNLIRILEDN